jgi:hypothetical protein
MLKPNGPDSIERKSGKEIRDKATTFTPEQKLYLLNLIAARRDKLRNHGLIFSMLDLRMLIAKLPEKREK